MNGMVVYIANEADLVINKLKQQNSKVKDLLEEIKNDDGSRYNRPSYYFKVLKMLDEMREG
jgi:hypothetical protein